MVEVATIFPKNFTLFSGVRQTTVCHFHSSMVESRQHRSSPSDSPPPLPLGRRHQSDPHLHLIPLHFPASLFNRRRTFPPTLMFWAPPLLLFTQLSEAVSQSVREDASVLLFSISARSPELGTTNSPFIRSPLPIALPSSSSSLFYGPFKEPRFLPGKTSERKRRRS